MIKFFRKIRYDYLKHNKLRNYLKYAIGEIVLVVIGILIAVQINSWNEERRDSAIEIEVLKEISENLGEDILSLENDIRLNKVGIENVQMIENELVLNETVSDTFLTHFGRITFNTTYTFKTSGYKNLSEIGFQIIDRDSIRKSITNLYETQYTFLKEREEAAEKITYGYLKPSFQEYFKEIRFDTSISKYSPQKLYYPKNYEGLKNDDDFQRLLDYSKEVKYENLYDINIVLRAIRSTKTMLDKYLEEKSD